MMKNVPIILSFLCTNMIWCSASKAMEDIILDRKIEEGRSKILVLTPLGRAKAESLEIFYDQQQAGTAEQDDDLNRAIALSLASEESDLDKAIRLSLENQPLGINPSSETKPQALESSSLPPLSLPLAKQEDDPQFEKVLLESAQEEESSQLKKALLESSQEYDAHKKRIAEEKRQAQERRDETIRLLQELRQVQINNILSLFSKIDELRNQEKSLLSREGVFTNEEKEKIKNLFFEKRNSVFAEIQTFKPLNSQISDEIQHLLGGGEHRDLPWMQELFLKNQGGASSSSPSLQGSLPQIPSSALPNLSGSSSKTSNSSDTPGK